MAVESIKMVARAHNDWDARVFTDMIYQVDLNGSLSEARCPRVGEGGKRACFVENTITKSPPITTEMSLNGKKVVSFTRNS